MTNKNNLKPDISDLCLSGGLLIIIIMTILFMIVSILSFYNIVSIRFWGTFGVVTLSIYPLSLLLSFSFFLYSSNKS